MRIQGRPLHGHARHASRGCRVPCARYLPPQVFVMGHPSLSCVSRCTLPLPPPPPCGDEGSGLDAKASPPMSMSAATPQIDRADATSDSVQHSRPPCEPRDGARGAKSATERMGDPRQRYRTAHGPAAEGGPPWTGLQDAPAGMPQHCAPLRACGSRSCPSYLPLELRLCVALFRSHELSVEVATSRVRG